MSRPLHELDACELRNLLDGGDVSSVEIVKALHDRADWVEPSVGAFAHQHRKEALEAAERCDNERSQGEHSGGLHGLPITIKESLATEGLASTLGIRSRLGKIEPVDAVVVQVAKEEGAVILGKTNIPQSLLAPFESTNSLFGTTNNPWNVAHAPGGSSGGEGAAVASGMSVMGIGTDIGGSIRTPAAVCGVCGIKPTVDRWSNIGSGSVIPGQEFIRAQTGPIARSARDLTLFMQALDSPKQASRDPRVCPLPLGDVDAVDVRKLRVGYYEDDGFITPAASVRRAIRLAVSLLEQAGIRVVRFSPPNVEEIAYDYMWGISADGAETFLKAIGEDPLIPPLRTLGRLVRMPRSARTGLAKALHLMGERRIAKMLESMGEKRIADYWKRTKRRNEIKLEEGAAWERQNLDVLITPSGVTPALPHGMSHDFTIAFASVARYNFLDLPAGVVPITRVRPDEVNRTGVRDRIDKRAAAIEEQSIGLPVSVQLVARPWREDKLLAVMQRLQELARPDDCYPTTPFAPNNARA